MKYDLDKQEISTILAALRVYQGEGLADNPDKRSDSIHDIATCGGDVVSMNNEAINALCEKLNMLPEGTPVGPTLLSLEVRVLSDDKVPPDEGIVQDEILPLLERRITEEINYWAADRDFDVYAQVRPSTS